MFEPVTILSAVGGVLGSVVMHVADLVQCHEEVEAACELVRSCDRKLNELDILRATHSALLDTRRPQLAESIEKTIGESAAALDEAKPILERNRFDRRDGASRLASETTDGSSVSTKARRRRRNPAATIGNISRWKVVDQRRFERCKHNILRNDAAVQGHLTGLQLLVELHSHRPEAEQARTEERRRHEERNRERADRAAEGLDILARPRQAEIETETATQPAEPVHITHNSSDVQRDSASPEPPSQSRFGGRDAALAREEE
jgi:hypothetical protein